MPVSSTLFPAAWPLRFVEPDLPAPECFDKLFFVIAVSTNADFLVIGRAMYKQPLLRQAAMAAVDKFLADNPRELQNSPAISYQTAQDALSDCSKELDD